MKSDYIVDTGAFKERIIKEMRLLKSWERVDSFKFFWKCERTCVGWLMLKMNKSYLNVMHAISLSSFGTGNFSTSFSIRFTCASFKTTKR